MDVYSARVPTQEMETGTSPDIAEQPAEHSQTNKMEDEDQYWRMSSDLHMCTVPNVPLQSHTHRCLCPWQGRQRKCS